MKKRNLAGLAVLGLAMLTTSCSEDVTTSDLTLDAGKSAKVKIYVYADTNLKTAGKEAAPVGTEIILKAVNTDFEDGKAGEKLMVYTVGEGGYFEATLPVASEGSVTYSIDAPDFEFDQVQQDDDIATTINKVYTIEADKKVTVISRTTEVVEVSFNEKEKMSGEFKFVDVNIYLRGDFDQNSAVLDPIPAGTSLTLKVNDKWSAVVTPENKNINGDIYSKISVSVPAGETIELLDFEAIKTIVEGSGESQKTYTKTYVYSATLASYSLGQNGDGFPYNLKDTEKSPF